MKISVDASSFLKQQEILTGEMVARVADHLEAAGLKGDVLKETTGRVAFEVACMIDGVSEVRFDGSEAHPYLMFQSGDNELVHLGGNSYMHELVYGILDAMVDQNT